MKVAVVGLGYVGLPLAVALAREHEVVGFDISAKRVSELRDGMDATGEVAHQQLLSCGLRLSGDPQELSACAVFIVTVPTPIDEANRPDLSALLKACDLIGPVLPQGAIVVFESTVYPGVTEEICGPALERASGLRAGRDFKLGYSPERINPGDREHPIEKIVKVIAGQDAGTLATLTDLYGSVIEAGIHQAPSIRVAEAAKVIENTQRDLNIALMNEIAMICERMDVSTSDVLAAAGTKWNFLRFHPGLVGGHCIGVDPYYLTAKAEQLGYQPEVILSGRRVNDGMAAWVAQKLVKLLAKGDRPLREQRVGVLGLTFKENVPDTRNSKVFDILAELRAFGLRPLAHDARVAPESLRDHHGVEPVTLEELQNLDALVYAVPHHDYHALEERMADMLVRGGVLVDLRARLDRSRLRSDLRYWSL